MCVTMGMTLSGAVKAWLGGVITQDDFAWAQAILDSLDCGVNSVASSGCSTCFVTLPRIFGRLCDDIGPCGRCVTQHCAQPAIRKGRW